MDPILSFCWLLTEVPCVCIIVADGTVIASSGEVTCHLCCATQHRLVFPVQWGTCGFLIPHPQEVTSELLRFPESKDAGVVHVAPRNCELNSILSH